MKRYEGMWVFDTTFASEWPRVEEELSRIMGRAEAETVFCRKWDERRLAYEINKQKRGCYVLTFFDCEPDRIVGIERDCKLSERILRVLISRAEGMTQERMEKNIPHRPTVARPIPEAGEKERAVEGEEKPQKAEDVVAEVDKPAQEVATAEVIEAEAIEDVKESSDA